MFGFCKSNTDIPLTHLDYGYIEKCDDAKMIESILKILRSGEEGYFPDLIQFTERRLESISPKSKLLQKESKVKMVNELQNDEGKKLLDDLQEWSEKIKDVDKNLVEDADQNKSNADYPPVRQQRREDQPESQPAVTKQQPRVEKSAAPRSYSEWDKLNVESEVKKVDEVINDKKLDATRIHNKTNPIPTKVEFSEGLSVAEKAMKANVEKDKGNEAFKAGDFKEALIYYDRSISLQRSAAVYNNRAITYIKMERFEEAILDCETVLMREPNNVKAYLRRGVALKHLTRYEKALEDFSKVLELAPSNNRARELYKDVKEHVILEDKRQKDVTENGSEVSEIKMNRNMKESGEEERTFVEEVKSSRDDETQNVTGNEVSEKKKGKRLKIIEVDSTDSIGKENAENVKKFHENSGSARDMSQNGTFIANDADNAAPKSEGSLEDLSSKRSENPDQVDVKADEKEQSQKILNTVGSDSPSKERNDQQDSVRSTTLQNGRPDSFYAKEQNLPVPDEIIEIKNEGNEFYKAGRYPEAEIKYSEAIDKLKKEGKGHDQSIAVLLSNRAICKVKIGDSKGCVKDATESLGIWPTAKAFLRIAAAYEHLENYRHAYADNMSALQIDNTLQAAWSATSRLSTLLMKRDGPGWRDHLPKSESFSNLMKLANYVPNSEKNEIVDTEREEDTKATNMETEERQNADDSKEQSKNNESEKEIETEEDIEKNKEKFRKTKELGNKHVQNKEFKDAITCYSECIEIFPDEVTCYTNRALCFLKLNQFRNAESDASRALAIQDDNVKALFRRALARKGLEKYEEGIKDLMNLLEIDKSNTAAKKELSAIREFKSTKKKIDVKEHGNESVENSLKTKEDDQKEANSRPKMEDGKGLKFQGEAVGKGENIKLNGIKEEKKKGKKMKIIEVENYDEIEAITGRQSGNDCVEEISYSKMKENVNNCEGEVNMGEGTCDEKCGKERDDVERREKLPQQGKEELKNEKLETASVVTEGRKKGERERDNRRSSNGKQKDKKIESMEEKFSRSKELGNRYVQEEKYEEAVKYYSQCIVFNANEPVPFVNRALCYLKLDKPKKAESDCSKALNLQPNNIKALFRRAMARKAGEKYKESLQDLTTLIKLDPKNTVAQKELEAIKELWRKELKNKTRTQSENSSESSATTVTQKSNKKRPESTETKEKQAPSVHEAAKARVNDICDGTPKCCSTTKENIQRSSKKLNLRKASGFEFLKAWNELKGKNLSDYASLLSQIEPSQLPKIISNKIDAEMILLIVSCVSEHFFTKDKLVFGFNILKYASKSERFNMGLMFLSTNDLSKVRTVIEEIASKLKDTKTHISAKDILELRKAYKAT